MWRAEAPTPVRSELAGSHRRKGKGGKPVWELEQGAGFCLLWPGKMLRIGLRKGERRALRMEVRWEMGLER